MNTLFIMQLSASMSWPQPPPCSGVTNWNAVRATHPELVDRLALGMYQTDVLADTAAAELLGARSGWQLLERVLGDAERNFDQAPDSLRALLTPLLAPPAWYEPSLAESGARAWWRFGSVQTITLFQSLLYGYQSPGLAKPLALTGRLTTGTSDRLAETGRWLLRATAPGGMVPGAKGWAETVRIRLVHAIVRRHLTERLDWDVDGWGVPINQTYSAFTISGGFLVLPLRVAADLGIRYSSAEYEAIAHQWRWIGYVMGVPEGLLPVSYAAAKQIFDIASEFEIEPDENARLLVKALLRDGYAFDQALPRPLDRIVGAALRPVMAASFSSVSTRWVPEKAARAMGLQRSPLHHLVDLARPAVRAREIARTLGLLGSEAGLANRELHLVLASLDRFSAKRTPLRPNEAA